MYERHPYTVHGVCPCRIGEDAIQLASELFHQAPDAQAFTQQMEQHRVIGRRIWYSKEENTIFLQKQFACESGGGCPANKSLIGQRCHCDHYNHSTTYHPKHYCKCGAEFYRPMFTPLFGDNVRIEPVKTVLAGDGCCVLAIRIGKVDQP